MAPYIKNNQIGSASDQPHNSPTSLSTGQLWMNWLYCSNYIRTSSGGTYHSGAAAPWKIGGCEELSNPADTICVTDAVGVTINSSTACGPQRWSMTLSPAAAPPTQAAGTASPTATTTA